MSIFSSRRTPQVIKPCAASVICLAFFVFDFSNCSVDSFHWKSRDCTRKSLDFALNLSDNGFSDPAPEFLYEPVHFERLRQAALGEYLAARCQKVWKLGEWSYSCDQSREQIQIVSLLLDMGRVVLQEHICDFDAPSGPAEAFVLVVDCGRLAFAAVDTLIQSYSRLWNNVHQINVAIDVCDYEDLMGSEISLVRDLAFLQESLERSEFDYFFSRRIPELSNRSPPPLIIAAGFPDHVCRYELAAIRHFKAPSNESSDVIGKPVVAEDSRHVVLEEKHGTDSNAKIDATWSSETILLDHKHVCSESASFPLHPQVDIVHIQKVKRSFPRKNLARKLLDSRRIFASRCHDACVHDVRCRTFNWLDDVLNPIHYSDSSSVFSGICTGCSDVSWTPFRHIGAATGVVIAPKLIDRWAVGDRAFFLQGEPKGGWTLTDMTGLQHSSDSQMLEWSVETSRTKPTDASGSDLEGRSAKSHDVCRDYPRAAVIYLVGSREDDVEALALSLASLDRFFLRPSFFCYPVFFFREQWDSESMSTIANLTNARTQFLAADMSFPSGFQPEGRHSQQSKRTKWGYQHMSRFWIRTVLEHPSISELEWYLRLDTDSRFTTPVLDLFLDAKERGLTYGYRIAGKDWIGKNKGLWNFHANFVKKMLSEQSTLDDVQRVQISELLNMALASEVGDGTEAPIFYTNFEVVNVQRFLRTDMWHYIVAVDESHGCYLHNWGDAQVRWLQVNTFLSTDTVHRYCHFGYVHAAAQTKAFQCWQEPWIGVDCPTASCNLHGRHPDRLLDMDNVLIAIGPTVRPAGSMHASPDNETWEGSLTLSIPACWQANGELGTTVTYHTFWLRTRSSAFSGPLEEQASRGQLYPSDCADGSLVIPFVGIPGSPPPTALVVEVQGQIVCNTDADDAYSEASHYDRTSEELQGARASIHRSKGCGCGREGLFIVLPVDDSGSLHIVAEFPTLGPSTDDDDTPTALPAAGEGELAESAQRLQRWYDLVRYALLSEEYVSRHLRRARGSDHDVRTLPTSVELALSRAEVMRMPYRARLIALHWVVLVILAQPGALQGLEELLGRYSPSFAPPGNCHPVWERGPGCVSRRAAEPGLGAGVAPHARLLL